QSPKPKAQSPKPKAQRPKPKDQRPKSKVQGPKPKDQSPQTTVQRPKLKSQRPKDQRTKAQVLRYTAAQLMRVLGIDPGSQTTGWGVVDGDGRRYKLIDVGSIRAPSTLAFPARLLRMCKGLEEVVERHRPDAC